MPEQINLVVNKDSKDLLSVGDAFLREYNFAVAQKCFEAFEPSDINDRRDVLARTLLLEGWQHKDRTQLSYSVDVLLSLSGLIKKYGLRGQLFVGGFGLISMNRTLGFLTDPRLLMLSEKYSHLLPISAWHWNLETVVWAISHALHLPGDFVELGVFKGHTSRIMADYFDFSAIPKKWYLYDTFDGIPDDQIDTDHWRTANQVYKGTFSFEEVSNTFSDCENMTVIKGRVPDILKDVCPSQISFLHVDMNNVEAEIEALKFLYDDRIVPGGVIIFDDYGWAVAEAQHIAANQWADSKGLKILELPSGQGLLMKPV